MIEAIAFWKDGKVQEFNVKSPELVIVLMKEKPRSTYNLQENTDPVVAPVLYAEFKLDMLQSDARSVLIYEEA